MKTNKIRLTESQLHRVIKESVKKVLKEEVDPSEVELFQQYYSEYDDKVRNLMSIHAFLLEQHFGHTTEEAMAETAVSMRRDTAGVAQRYGKVYDRF